MQIMRPHGDFHLNRANHSLVEYLVRVLGREPQGQTFQEIAIYLPGPVFTHGQLYIGLSRGTPARSP